MFNTQSPPYSIFLNLLKSELWQTSLDLSLTHKDFLAIYELASKQAVLGMIADSIVRNNVRLEKEDVITVLSIRKRLATSNRSVNTELVSLCNLFADNGIEAIVVKGQTIAHYYPNPLARTPGDIDFYCNESNLPKIISAMKKTWGVCAEGKPTEQHYSLVHNSVILELHHCLIKFASVKSQKIWNKILLSSTPANVMVNGKIVPTLEPTLNLLYTFLHLYHHLIELGVGLRQFCDITVLLKAYHNVIDRRLLYTWLDALGFRKAFDAVQLVLIEVLGLDKKYALTPLSLDKSSLLIVKKFMDVVWFGGNFGFYGHDRDFRFKSQYFLMATYRKLQLYYRFYRFSPREIRSSIFSSIPHKVVLAIKGNLD